MGSNFSLQFGFFCVIPWTGIDLFFFIPWGSRIWVSSPVFLLYCLRYLLLWVLVFWKLRRLPGQPAEAKAQAYGACFEDVRVIGKLFEDLQHIRGRVRQGRVERSHFSCRSYGLCSLSAVSSTVLNRNKLVSAINWAFYAFKWPHQVAGVDSPTLHPTVISAKKGALRLVCQPASPRKEPFEVTHLKELAERTDFGNILHLRSLVMFVLAFSDVQFFSSYVTIFIEKSKTDQLRENRDVVIAETRSSTCPCYLLMAYMNKTHRAGNSEEYLFRPISSSENRKRLVSVTVIPLRSLFRILYPTYQGLVLIPRDQEKLLWQPIQASPRETFSVTIVGFP